MTLYPGRNCRDAGRGLPQDRIGRAHRAYRDTPIYQRDLLPLGAQFDGPAIVEQPDTTTVVYPGFTCRVDDAGNLLLTLFTR